MKLILAMLVLSTFSAFAQRGTEAILQCNDGTLILVDVHERRNLTISMGNDLKRKLMINTEAATYPTAAIGQANEGVFYPSQFQGMLVTLKERREIRILKKNDSLEVTLFDSKNQRTVAKASAEGCR